MLWLLLLSNIVKAKIDLNYISRCGNEGSSTNYNRKFYLTEYSLIDGILAVDSSAIYNLKFFGPFTQRNYHLTDDKWFAFDSTNEGVFIGDPSEFAFDCKALSFVASQLFPSPQYNDVSVFSNDSSDKLAHILDISKKFELDNQTLSHPDSKCHKSYLELIAGLLFCCLNKNGDIKGYLKQTDQGFVLEINDSKGKKKEILLMYDQSSISNCIEVLNLLLKIDDSKISQIMNSSVLFKAFIACYLNSSNEIDYMYEFLDKKLLAYFGIEEPHCDDEAIDLFLSKISSKFVKLGADLQDYNKYISGCEMPFILGNRLFSRSKQFFDNSVENSLYRFVNILLYDFEKQTYLTSKGNSNLNSLNNIFKGNFKSSWAKKDMLRWHILVENLPNSRVLQPRDLKEKPNSNRYDSFDNICYLKKFRDSNNQLATGLINSLKVFEHLFRNKKESVSSIYNVILSNDFDIKRSSNQIVQIIKEFILDVVGEEGRSSIVDVNGEIYSSDDIETYKYENFELFGKLEITKKYKDGQNILSILDMKNGSVECYIVPSGSKTPSLLKSDLDSFFTENPVPGTLRDKLTKMMVYTSVSIDKIPVKTLSLQETISSEINVSYLYDLIWYTKFDASITALKGFDLIFARLENNHEVLPIYSQIISNLVISLPLDDSNVFSSIKSFLNNNICFLFEYDCISNGFLLKKALEKIFFFRKRSEILFKKWVSAFNCKLDGSDCIEQISEFLNNVVFEKKVYRRVSNTQRILALDHLAFSYQVFKGLELNDSHKAMYLPIISLFIDDLRSEIEDLGTCYTQPFYSKIVENILNPLIRSNFMCDLVGLKIFLKSTEFCCDLAEFLRNDTRIYHKLTSQVNEELLIYFLSFLGTTNHKDYADACSNLQAHLKLVFLDITRSPLSSFSSLGLSVKRFYTLKVIFEAMLQLPTKVSDEDIKILINYVDYMCSFLIFSMDKLRRSDEEPIYIDSSLKNIYLNLTILNSLVYRIASLVDFTADERSSLDRIFTMIPESTYSLGCMYKGKEIQSENIQIQLDFMKSPQFHILIKKYQNILAKSKSSLKNTSLTTALSNSFYYSKDLLSYYFRNLLGNLLTGVNPQSE